MILQLIKRHFPDAVSEFRFNPSRRWRADFAIPSKMILIEIEGGAWTRGRHTRGAGYIKDMEKYNSAQMMGYKVLRYTPQQLGWLDRDLEALKATLG